MDLNYRQDRLELGFSCIKDIDSVQQLCSFSIAIEEVWILKKGKHIVLLIFSKELLLAVCVFAKSKFMTIDQDFHLA